MDASEQIKVFYEFFDLHYKAVLFEQVRVGKTFINVDFSILSKFDPQLAEVVLDNPEETIKAAEKAVDQFDLEGVDDFKVRFFNLPKEQKIRIRNIRSKHLGKLLFIEGLVRQKSDVRPQVTIAKFECPSCGNLISVYQLDQSFKEPTRCGCGRKGKFRLIDKELVDAQRIVVQENPELLEGGEQAKRIPAFLKRDLVSPISEKKTNPGSKIGIVGFVKEVPVMLRTGAKSTTFDLMIEANYVEAQEESYGDIKFTDEQVAEFKEMSQDKEIFEKLINAMAPSIYGHDKIKEALLLQILSGVRKKREDGSIIRGDIHVLLVGDPGAGKSALLKRGSIVAPKSRYVSGKGASSAGLTASVVKDEFIKGWSLEAGALVLTNKGICIIDELDKMSKEDRSAFHEALEQQTVSIAKANIQATLRCETTVLAAANPRFGRFDAYKTIAEQIDLPPPLISRFDLIFPVKDIPDKKRDEEMAGFILSLHKDLSVKKTLIDTKKLRNYLSYARQKIKPELSQEAFEAIKDYYVMMRSKGSIEGGVKTIPITARQLEALVRLAEASAKIRLSKIVQKEDAQKSIDLVHYCLELVGMDKETGKFDIDRISSGVTASTRNKINIVRKAITELEKVLSKKSIEIKEIVNFCDEKGIDEEEVEEILEKLKRSGDIFEPRRGLIQKIE